MRANSGNPSWISLDLPRPIGTAFKVTTESDMTELQKAGVPTGRGEKEMCIVLIL